MSNFIKALIAVGILLVIGFFIGKSCSKEEVTIDHARENELLQEVKQLKVDNQTLTAERDSLLKIPTKIKTQIVYREQEIDANISKDSSYALVEFRKALTENQITADGTETPTNRELGWSAKLMAKVPKLELQIKGYDEIILKDNEIISNLNFQIGANEDLREMQRLAILNCEKQLEDKNSFWYDRFVISIGAGGGYDGENIRPFIGATIGVKVWGSK